MSRKIHVLAPAKINLTLEVLGRRADGYHDLASVMTTVDLYDDVRIGPARALDVRIRPPIHPGGPAVDAPRGEDLASRAVRAIAAACGREPNVHVIVRKRIPVAAGLGGGSSDAGAVLRAVRDLWELGDIDLMPIAAAVGSDVPFFAAGCVLARVGGRGEHVEPIAPSSLPGGPAEPLWISLVTPPARSATRDVCAAFDGPRGDGRATDEVVRLFATGTATPAALRARACNDLTAAAERVSPIVAEARAAARERGIDLHVSGSGPSLFAIADDRAHAIRMSRSLRRAGLRARPHALAVATLP